MDNVHKDLKKKLELCKMADATVSRSKEIGEGTSIMYNCINLKLKDEVLKSRLYKRM